MKKKLSFALSLVSIALLVSCGGNSQPSQNPSSTEQNSVSESSENPDDSSQTSSSDSNTLPKQIFAELKNGYALESKNSMTGYLLDSETNQKVPNTDYVTSYIVDITHVEGEHAYQMYQPVSSLKVIGNAVADKTKVYTAQDIIKGEDGKAYSKTLGIDNTVSTIPVQDYVDGQISLIDYDEFGFDNIFRYLTPSHFHAGRNEGSYEIDLSVLDEEAQMAIGDNLACSSLSVADDNGVTEYPEMDYFRILTENGHVTGYRVGYCLTMGEKYIRYDFRGDVLAEGKDNASDYFVHQLDETGKDDLKNRINSLKNSNYSEDFLEYYGQSVETDYSYASQPDLLFSSHTKYDLNDNKVRYTRYNENGKAQSEAYVVLDDQGAGQNVVSVSDKGFYPAGEKQEKVNFPGFDISAALFDLVPTDDGSVVYEYLRSKHPYVRIHSSYFSFEASSLDLDRLTISLKGDSVVFHGYYENQAVDGSAWTKLEFRSTFSSIGTTDFTFDVSDVHENGNDLVWSDFFSSNLNYESINCMFGGDTILDQIPTFGSYYNDPYLVLSKASDKSDIISYRYYLGSIMDYVDYGEGADASLDKLTKTLNDFNTAYMSRFSNDKFEIQDYTQPDGFPVFAAVMKDEFDLEGKKKVMGVVGRAVFDNDTYSLYYEVLPTVMAAQRSVTFEFNYPEESGATRDPESYEIDDGSLVQAPSCSLKGYTFDGWYTQKDGGVKADFTAPVTADVTYYAHWVKDAE